MWEVTIVGKIRDIIYFEQLQDRLKDEFDKDVLVAVSLTDNLVCSIATINEHIINLIEKLIFETMIKCFKLELFETELEFIDNNKSLNSLILSTLISLDITDEINYAIHNSKLSNVINIRSFVNFRLNYLVKAWKTLTQYINIMLSSKSENFYIEFLKIIANEIKTDFDVMYLECNNKNIELLDKNKKIVYSMTSQDEVDLIVNLLIYSPDKLIINCYNELSHKLTEMLKYIFEDKISVLL